MVSSRTGLAPTITSSLSADLIGLGHDCLTLIATHLSDDPLSGDVNIARFTGTCLALRCAELRQLLACVRHRHERDRSQARALCEYVKGSDEYRMLRSGVATKHLPDVEPDASLSSRALQRLPQRTARQVSSGGPRARRIDWVGSTWPRRGLGPVGCCQLAKMLRSSLLTRLESIQLAYNALRTAPVGLHRCRMSAFQWLAAPPLADA